MTTKQIYKRACSSIRGKASTCYFRERVGFNGQLVELTKTNSHIVQCAQKSVSEKNTIDAYSMPHMAWYYGGS